VGLRFRVLVANLCSCGGCELLALRVPRSVVEGVGQVNVHYLGVTTDRIPVSDVAILCGFVRGERERTVFERAVEACLKLVLFGSCACYGVPPPARVKRLRGYLVTLSVPGCPPPFNLAKEVLRYALYGGSPPKARRGNVCAECPLSRVATSRANGICFLETGGVCLGPFTVAGCNASCPRVGVPCEGCRGPISGAEREFLSLARFSLVARRKLPTPLWRALLGGVGVRQGKGVEDDKGNGERQGRG